MMSKQVTRVLGAWKWFRNDGTRCCGKPGFMVLEALQSSADSASYTEHCTVWDSLVRSFGCLGKENFEKLKLAFSDFRHDVKDPIGYGHLEDADCSKTAKIIIDYYGEENILELTIKIYMKIHLRGPAEDLQKKHNLIYFRINYMEQVKDQYQWMKEKNGLLGEGFNLERRYTNLLLLRKHRNERERENEIKSSGTKHLDIMEDRSSNYSITTIDALFDADEEGNPPKVVVLQGPAGIGKTMTAKKIMLDWTAGCLYQDKFKYVFYMSSTMVNQITGKMSIASFIINICQLSCSQQVMESILKDSEKILFLVDGFDELGESYMIDNPSTESPFHKTTKEAFFSGLFKKRFLRKSSVVITTRPFILEKLKDFIECLSYVEILGLKDREEYFLNFFEEKEQAKKFLDLIKKNETLFTMCAVPMTCWIVCTVLQQQIEDSIDVIHYNTSTSVYTLYLQSLLVYHWRKSDVPLKAYLKKLCTLAKDGVWNKKVLFDKVEIQNNHLHILNMKSLILNENIFRRGITLETCYSFIHLSVQEFFAALYYLLNEETGSLGPQEEVIALLDMSKNHPHLALTVKFLFGLSSRKQINTVEKIIGCKISYAPNKVLEDWLVKILSKCKCHNEILHYLNEIQDDDIVKRVMSQLWHVECEGLIPGSIDAQDNLIDRSLAFCLEKSTCSHSITIMYCSFSPESLKTLSSSLRKCSKLKFDRCFFPNGDISCIFKSANKFKELHFSKCKLTPSSCKSLLSSIKNRSLTKLDLKWNELQDSGAKVLCEGFRHPGCILQELGLEKCSLGSSCCEDLCSVIIMNKCLIKLELSQNDIQDSGVKYLCEGLVKSTHSLQELGLEDCKLTSSCCEDLYSVFTTNRSLTKLDLSENKLGDSGVKRLCEGLKDPCSMLQELRLQECDLTSLCCEDLQSVISKNRCLTSLDLSTNDLEDQGVKYLCEGLRHIDCVLNELRLESCLLTSSCCEDFKSVLLTNKSLAKLDLSWNGIAEMGLKSLWDGLKHQNCVLQQLVLEDCDLTLTCVEDLCSVIIINCSLTKLNLAANHFKKSGKSCLLQSLRHPCCTLKELRLSAEPINVGEYRKRKGLLPLSNFSRLMEIPLD
uniref:NACHT, LRR and PYD domains-containing protein 3 n=1 Tax=Leptobrachium leishanense TaxID=445787 RepID=A0A8C5N135_9ANUR